MKNKCLKCGKEYEAKRPTSKYCSVSCRVAYNRKNAEKNKIGKEDLKSLYNSLKNLVDKIELGEVRQVPITEQKKSTNDKKISSTEKPQKEMPKNLSKAEMLRWYREHE